MRISAIAVLSALIVSPSYLHPQEAHSVNTGQIKYSVGKVSVQPRGKGDWIEAYSGLELAVGDNLWADMNSEVEINTIGSAVMVGPETSIAFDELNDSDVKLNLRLGSVIVQVPATDESRHWEIGTPNLRFTLSESGDYRLDVNGEGNETDITAKWGQGQAIVDGAPYKVMAGQQLTFKTKDHVEVTAGEIPETDSFDIWAADHNRPAHRDEPQHDEEEVANVATDPAVTERASRRVWESNGDAGHWVYTADIGPVWVPTHWSELIVLPMPNVGVVSVEGPSLSERSSQERSVSVAHQNVVLEGMPSSTGYSPARQSVPIRSAPMSSPRNPAGSAPPQGYAGPGPLQTTSHDHDVAHPPQISMRHTIEAPHISLPKPATATSDKPKK